jgi:hypothetical protein
MRRIFLCLFFLLFFPSIASAPTWPIKTRASQVSTNTSNFDVNLSSTDTNVQKALDTLDELVLSVEESDVQISSSTASIDFRDGLDVTESPTGEANVIVDPDEVISTGTYIYWSGHTLNVNLSTGVITQAYDADLDDLADGTLSASKIEDKFLRNYENDSTNYQITVSSLVVTNTATVGSLSSSGQVTSNGNKVIDVYDYAICISTPVTLGTVATLVSPFRNYAVTISTISAQIIGGTNVIFMIEQRTIAEIESAGTDIWTGDITALPTNWTGGATSDFTVPADSALVLVPTSVSGNVDRLMIKYRLTKD